MGAIGDPRADVGYLLATYSRAQARTVRSARSPVTAEARLPVARRARRALRRRADPLAWFEALALWKASVFCEAIYGRYIRGELGAEDTLAAASSTASRCWRSLRSSSSQALPSATRAQRRRVARRDEQRRRARLAPRGDPVARSAPSGRRARPRRRMRPAPSPPPRAGCRRETAPGSRAPPPRSRSARTDRCRSSSPARPCRRCRRRSTP